MRYLVEMWKTVGKNPNDEEKVAFWFDPKFKPEPVQEFTTYGNAFKSWFNEKLLNMYKGTR